MSGRREPHLLWVVYVDVSKKGLVGNWKNHVQGDRRTEIAAPGQNTFIDELRQLLVDIHSPCCSVRSGGKNCPACLDLQTSFLPIVSSSSRTLRRFSWVGGLHAFLVLDFHLFIFFPCSSFYLIATFLICSVQLAARGCWLLTWMFPF